MSERNSFQKSLYGGKKVVTYDDKEVISAEPGASIAAGQIKGLLCKIPYGEINEQEGKYGTFYTVIVETLNGEHNDGSVISKLIVEVRFSSKRLRYILQKLFGMNKQHYNENKVYLLEGSGTGFDRHYSISEVEEK